MKSRSEVRTYSFIIVSILTHIALAAGILIYKVRSTPPPGSEGESTPVEMISEGDSPAPIEVSEAPKVVAVAPHAPVQAVQESQPPAPSPEPVPVAKKSSPAKSREKTEKPIAHSLPKKSTDPVDEAKELSGQDTPVQTESPVVVVPVAQDPQKMEPPEEPEESNEDVTSQNETKPEVNDESVAEEDPSVDESQTDSVSSNQEDLADQAEQQKEEQEARLAAAQKENEERSERLAREQAARQERERDALAAAAAERMAQEAQAERQAEQAQKAEAARIAEEGRAAEKAKADALLAGSDQGSGGKGSKGQMSGSSTGDGGDVRALSDLRPMPGNKRPQYDADDRLKGRQGEVAFLAYVSKEGTLTEFKMLQSSGHRELDAKTLKALKRWKFYPGQEGWVEIPFKWDLNGGPQEMPTTLRRRAQVSQSQNN